MGVICLTFSYKSLSYFLIISIKKIQRGFCFNLNLYRVSSNVSFVQIIKVKNIITIKKINKSFSELRTFISFVSGLNVTFQP